MATIDYPLKQAMCTKLDFDTGIAKLATLNIHDQETDEVVLAVVEREALSSLTIKAPISHLTKKLLVLDLNGILVNIVSPPPKGVKADINIARRAVFLRPFCSDFLNFCFERFEVGVWSSRTKKNIDKVVDFVLGDLKDKLLFCWDMSHCTKTGFMTLENRYKELVFKELKRIWEKQDPNLPWHEGCYNESNTLLLDDSPYKGLLNPAHTTVYPNSFHYVNKDDDKSLGPGGTIRVYLENLAAADNVQEFVEKHPFGLSHLCEKSESWEFYLQVLHSLNALVITG